MTETEKKLLTYLGSCIFETDESPRLYPTNEEIPELFELAERFDADKYLLYYYRDILPKELLKTARLNYITSAGEDVKRLHTLNYVEQLLIENKIDYRLLKGSFLTQGIYPNNTLRFCSDIDILVREKDSKTAFKLLFNNGWQYKDNLVKKTAKHMPELHHKNFKTIEFHTYLFNNEDTDENKKLWFFIDNGAIDELMVAHILKHAFMSHDFENGVKTLFDIGYILSSRNIDFIKLSNIEYELYAIEFMPLMIQAFKEFFPRELYSYHKEVSSDLCTALRGLPFQDLSWEKFEKKKLELHMENGGEGKFKRIIRVFADMSPYNLRRRFSIKSDRKLYCFYPYFIFRAYQLII